MKIFLLFVVLFLYLCIGAFLSGLFGADEYTALFITFWPSILIIGLFISFIELLYKFGRGFKK